MFDSIYAPVDIPNQDFFNFVWQNWKQYEDKVALVFIRTFLPLHFSPFYSCPFIVSRLMEYLIAV